MIKNNTKAYVLWVDDNLFNSNIENSTAYKEWANIFRNSQEAIPELLDITLMVTENYTEAKDILDSIIDDPFAYITAILDLSIPLTSNSSSEKKWGIELGVYLKKKNINFYFLSQSSDAVVDLARRGLAEIPFYTKGGAGLRSNIIPLELGSRISLDILLSLTWLRFEQKKDSLVEKWALEDRIYPFYPFTGRFRQNVSFWQTVKKNVFPLILRCPEAMNGDFIMLHLKMIGARGFYDIHFEEIIGPDYNKLIQFFSTKAYRQDEQRKGIIIRFKSTHISENDDLVKLIELIDENHHIPVALVLPNDSKGDEFLLDKVHPHLDDIYISEIPYFHLYDKDLKKEMIKNIAELVVYSLLRNECEPQDSVYMINAELLFNPCLIENLNNDITVVDPWEINKRLSDAIDKLLGRKSRLSQKNIIEIRKKLKKSQPLPVNIEKGSDFLAGDWIYNNPIEIPVLVDAWLTEKWKDPIKAYPKKFNAVLLEQWENHSVKILAKLVGMCNVEKFGETTLADNKKKALQRIILFFNHPLVQKMLRNLKSINKVDFSEEIKQGKSVFLRWPFQEYPLPTSLNNAFRKLGLNSWIQNSELHLAMMIPELQSLYKQLDAKIALFKSYKEVMESWITVAPVSIANALKYLLSYISDPWKESDDAQLKRRLWRALFIIFQNELYFSGLFKALIRNELDVYRDICSRKQYGTIIGYINCDGKNGDSIFIPTEELISKIISTSYNSDTLKSLEKIYLVLDAQERFVKGPNLREQLGNYYRLISRSEKDFAQTIDNFLGNKGIDAIKSSQHNMDEETCELFIANKRDMFNLELNFANIIYDLTMNQPMVNADRFFNVVNNVRKKKHKDITELDDSFPLTSVQYILGLLLRSSIYFFTQHEQFNSLLLSKKIKSESFLKFNHRESEYIKNFKENTKFSKEKNGLLKHDDFIYSSGPEKNTELFFLNFVSSGTGFRYSYLNNNKIVYKTAK